MAAAYRVAAVAYHPRVVTIWEGFREWFQTHDLPLEYRLFSTYDEQVGALFAGEVDVAWNTNLAYVRVREQAGGACRAIAMRNTDIDWTSHVIVGDDSTGVESLRGRRIGFGDRDSPQAWILPAYGLRMEGLDPVRDITADRLDRDVGKHGDTGGAEIAQLARLRSGELDGTVLSAPTWANVKAAGEAEGLSIAWTTRPFHHCNFTVLDTDGPAHERFAELLGTMLPSEPDLEEPMRLEWVERWVPGDETGYADLIEAVREFA